MQKSAKHNSEFICKIMVEIRKSELFSSIITVHNPSPIPTRLVFGLHHLIKPNERLY